MHLQLGSTAVLAATSLVVLFAGEPDLQDALIDRLSGTTSLAHDFEEAVDGIETGEKRLFSYDGKQYQISLAPRR